MTTYMITVSRANETGFWMESASSTLLGAKREATRGFGAGYIGDRIAIGEKRPWFWEGEEGGFDVVVLATKTIGHARADRWISEETPR